ncbi:MAG TPA: DnaA regulatory inactivator Hda [Gammaproteobacteria bacterium]|nr:DnaA regulatory inactivator Hda [Gammaproteobacteria bacterium]
MTTAPEQLALGVGLSSGSTFADFHGEAQPEALALAERLALRTDYPIACLWGAAETGKTHLLQAACRAAIGAGRTAAYLPLADAGYLDPALLNGWDRFELVCVDDVDRIAGQPRWEGALFTLFNALHESAGTLLAAARTPPAGADWTLADWQSRLAWGPVVRLAPLDDAARLAILRLRASRRGLKMPDEVAGFLLHRAPRDLISLMRLLDRLDQASLALQRRLTIPLVKEVLERGSGFGIRDSGKPT